MKILVPLFCLITLAANAQTDTMHLPVKDGKVFYEEVVQLDSAYTKGKLFAAANQWALESFNNYKYVLQQSDKENGRITLKTNFDVTCKGPILSDITENVSFLINIDVKDGKYRAQLYGFDNINSQYALYQKQSAGARKWRACFIATTDANLQSILHSIKLAMEKSAKADNF
jgi:hypothetical protein